MENQGQIFGYKWEILKKLKQRNENERKDYGEIFQTTYNQYEQLDVLRVENRKLVTSNEKLQSNIELASLKSGMKTVLKKLRKHNRELSQELTNLRTTLNKTELELKDKTTEVEQLKASLSTKESQCQFMKGEYEALQLAYSKLSLSTTEKERQKVDSWMLLKSENADSTKSENTDSIKSENIASTELKKDGSIKSENIASTELKKDSSIKSESNDSTKSENTPSAKSENTDSTKSENADSTKSENTVSTKPKNNGSIKSKNTDSIKSEEESNKRENVELQKEMVEVAEEVTAVAFTIHTTKVQDRVTLRSFVSSNGYYKFTAEDSEVNAIAWTRSYCKFATAGGDCTARLWDFSSGLGFLKEGDHKSYSAIYSLDLSHEETLMLAASGDGACRIWTTSDMKIKHTLYGHSKKVMSAKFLRDIDRAVSGSWDRTLKIWDLQRGDSIQTIFSCSVVNDVATLYGSIIVSGHKDKTIRFWDLRCNSQASSEVSLLGRITSLDFSPDGCSLLSSVRDDDCLQLIDTRKNGIVHTFGSDEFLIGHDWTRAKMSPCGQFCVCGAQDGGVYVWVVSTEALLKVLEGHSSTVIACAWSCCGNYLLSCDRSGKAVLRLEF